MIRHDRAHITPLTERDVAALLGVPWNTWTKTPETRRQFRDTVPTVTHSRTRTTLYDPDQVNAFLNRADVPPLPLRDSDLDASDRHPDDLLDDHEAAEVRGCTYVTLRTAANRGFLTGSVTIAGVRMWPRHTLTPKPAGRPTGSRDTAPRGGQQGLQAKAHARIAEITADLDAGIILTTAEVAARYGVSTRTAERYLAEARRAHTSTR